MIRPRFLRTGGPLLLAVAAVLVGPIGGGAQGMVAAADPPPLRVVGDARYGVESATSRVRVAVGLAIQNTRGETRTRRYWFDRAYLAVQPSASGFRVSGGGSNPTVRVTSSTKDHRLIEIGFGRRLYSGQSLNLRLTFFLRDSGGAPERAVRVGPALVSFPVWAFASDATSGARATVTIPAGYELQYGGKAFAFSEELDSGGLRLATGPLPDAAKFRGYVVATGEAAFVDSSIPITTADGKLDVTLSGWADDAPWRGRMGTIVRDAATAVAADTGLPGPAAGLLVQEATSWALEGSSVVWDPTLGRLLVAHDARPAAVTRGIAQAFLTSDVVAERWAVEGLAEMYAQRAAETMGVAFQAPKFTEEERQAAGPLNAWPGPSTDGAEADGAVRATAAELMRRVTDALGPEGTRAALVRLAAGTSVYQPASAPADGPERAVGPADWRRMLDAFDAEAPSADVADGLSELWTTFVVRPDEASLLAERRDSRARYAETVTSSAGWALPAAIREAMTNWRFDAAETLMDGIDIAMARQRAIEITADQLALKLPDEIQPLFERGRLDAAIAEADAEAAALAAIAAAEALSEPTEPLAGIGLLGEEPASDLAAARAAFEEGRLEDAVASAATARSTWLEAEEVGRSRAAMAGLLVGALGILLLAVRSRLRPRARRLAGSPVDGVARR